VLPSDSLGRRRFAARLGSHAEAVRSETPTPMEAECASNSLRELHLVVWRRRRV
jgi:hypothetical protein